MQSPEECNKLRLLTWNIGSFITRKYFRFYLKGSERYEYFQPEINSEFVSDTILRINPNFVFLQELFERQDFENIKIIEAYEHKKHLDMWYGKGRAMIASKIPFTMNSKNDIDYISLGNLTIIPIHLNAYSASVRLQEIHKIISTFKDDTNIVLLGDFNIWERKGFFLFRDDVRASKILRNYFVDISQNIPSTSYLGFALDKVFASKDTTSNNLGSSACSWWYAESDVSSSKDRGKHMDHYPLFFDINKNSNDLWDAWA